MQDDLSIRARDALSEFLASQEWDCWLTATSAKKLRYPRQAIQLVSDSISGLASRYFVGAECHYLGGWHSHGLVKFREESIQIIRPHVYTSATSETIGSQRLLEIRLSRRGFNRVEPCRNQASVANYVSKYITKDLNADWELFGYKGWVDISQKGSTIEQKA